MRLNYKRLGEYIEPCDEKNIGNTIKKLQGISNRKYFQKAKTNIIGIDLSKYRVVRTGQFAFNRATTRNSDKISIALRHQKDCIVSPSYRIFKSKDENILNSEYLMMWFKRPEFDRYARFKSHGSAHEFFDYKEMCEVELPIPNIERQKAIVKEYNTVAKRIQLNEQLNQKLEETAQALYKHWFVDFEFPDENGEPYKSSGGDMVYNEELDREIPEGWEPKNLSDIADIKGGKRMPSGESLVSEPTKHPYIKVADLGIEKFALLNEKYEYVPVEAQSRISRYIVSEGELILSIVGTIGIAKIIGHSLDKANLTENCVKINVKQKVDSSFIYHYLKSKEGQEEIKMRNVGAVQAKLPIYNIETFPILCPTDGVFRSFKTIMKSLDDRLINTQKENVQLFKIRDLLLSKMATLEEVKQSA
ncbi:MAG: restriction endonuclease subunit S [Aequorivita sp.]